MDLKQILPSMLSSLQIDFFRDALKQFHGHDIVLHSLDPSGKYLIEGLLKTQRFKYQQEPVRTIFYAVHEEFSLKIYDVLINVLKLKLLWSKEYNAWCVEREVVLKSNVPTPPDVYVKELASEDALLVNNVWPYRYPGSEKKIMDCLRLTKGFGVYLKSDDKLVSWVTSSRLGQLTALQTLEEHKKKGYGSLAAFHMSKYLAQNGFQCFASVYEGNTGSEMVMSKLGFTKRFKCMNIAIDNTN